MATPSPDDFQKPSGPAPSGLKITVTLILIVAVIFLAVRAFGIASQPGGACVLMHQPSIFIGSAPSFTTELDCALSNPGGQPTTPAPAPVVQVPVTPPPPGVPAAYLVFHGATHPPARQDVYCIGRSHTYAQLYGPAHGWYLDHDDPQNSPCR